MTPAETASLLELAARLDRMRLSSRRDPEQPFIERSELSRDLRRLAGIRSDDRSNPRIPFPRTTRRSSAPSMMVVAERQIMVVVKRKRAA